MDIIDKIVEHIGKPQEETKSKAPDGLCPVCWGIQEYDWKIRLLVKDKQIEINNHQSKDMIIREFVKEHIDGIHLQQGDIIPCPSCSNKNQTDK
jgi:2-keto-4-pentenoate hydratase/2-oxohepta-3-ene-1,7-dioic acid hydratase in catechol pathway